MTNNISTVKRIGAGVRITEQATEQIVATAPEGFDPSKRGAVADLVHAWACQGETPPPVKVGPKGNQRPTDYGRGVDTLTKAVKRALSDDSAATDWIKLVRQAAENANVKGEIHRDVILDAVNSALAAVVEQSAAA